MVQVDVSGYLAALQAGELVSFPTDTVPALAARPEAGERIYQIKQRSSTKPLILMAASLEPLLPYLAGQEAELEIWRAVVQGYWPGALTLVLPASDRLPAAINPMGTGSLGLRVPAHPLARYILERSGPLATTSVNRSGSPPLQTMADIQAQFPQVFTLTGEAITEIYADLATDPPDQSRPQGSGQPSTVVAWQGHKWQVLRQGLVHLEIRS
jgi:L-threonylcarbamoyladenylate synthase